MRTYRTCNIGFAAHSGEREFKMRSNTYNTESNWIASVLPDGDRTDAKATLVACLIMAGAAGIFLIGSATLVGGVGFGIWELFS
jgi:hypothetical protein